MSGGQRKLTVPTLLRSLVHRVASPVAESPVGSATTGPGSVVPVSVHGAAVVVVSPALDCCCCGCWCCFRTGCLPAGVRRRAGCIVPLGFCVGFQHTLAVRFIGEALAHHAATFPHFKGAFTIGSRSLGSISSP